MCDPGTLIIMSTALAVAGTVTSTMATVHQQRYEAKVADYNRAQESAKAADAIERGNIESRDASRKQAQLAGVQRASMAANGIDVSFGAAADLLGDTAMLGQDERTTIRENTRREVMGYDINAVNYGAKAQAARSSANAAIVSGVLQGVSSIAGGAQKFGASKASQAAGGSGW